MSNDPQSSLLFMLGEMRADLKYLVNERRKTSERLDEIEAGHAALTADHEARLTTLEHFKTKIGLLATGLGVAVPTLLSVVAHRLGFFQ